MFYDVLQATTSEREEQPEEEANSLAGREKEEERADEIQVQGTCDTDEHTT